MYFFTCLILVFFSLLLYLYFVGKKAHSYFQKNGIPYLPPIPIFGNMADTLLMREHMHFAIRNLYQKLEPHRFAGLYFMYKPTIMFRDPELIKHILIKDFAYFHDRGMHVNADVEPLSNHLFSMQGDEWKNLRIKLTNTFTTGKMKMMFPLMKTCAEKLINVLEQPSDSFDIKDLSSRFATDVIGTCAFGIEIHSIENPETIFRTMGKRIFQFRYRALIRSLIPNVPSKIIKMFNLTFLDQEVADYFFPLIKNTVKHREDNHIIRYDFLDLLIALKNNTMAEKFHDNDQQDIEQFLDQIGEKQNKSNIDMTIELIAAQCILFFGAGFETSAAALSFLMFELACNENIQTKVRDEIKTIIDDNGGELTYEVLKNMTYVDMVIAETLRKYPPSGILSRECTIDYKIPDTEIIIPKKTQINIPIFALHTDEKYYEKPNDFYPEHFTEEAKANRPRFVYLPFGDGPRVCIAQRFAKMQIKVGLIYMIKNFYFKLSPKMKLPLKYIRNFGLFGADGEILLEFQKL